ncbi:hypothetical protein Tco_1187682, partial [Tanacetum coccineum]
YLCKRTVKVAEMSKFGHPVLLSLCNDGICKFMKGVKGVNRSWLRSKTISLTITSLNLVPMQERYAHQSLMYILLAMVDV